MKTARCLGYANPDTMLGEMSAQHLAEWMAYDAILAKPTAHVQTADEARAFLEARIKR